MPAKFEGLGIQFLYPENWKLDDSDALQGRRSITVSGPGGGFWSVALHSGSTAPARLAQAVVDTMSREYEGLEAEKVTEDIAGREVVGYDLSFFCLDLTNTAQIRSFHSGYTTYAVFCQAEDAEFRQVGMVFRAMLTSLINSLNCDVE